MKYDIKQGFSKGILIKKFYKKFTIYSPNHLKNALSELVQWRCDRPTNHSISKVTSRLNYCPAGELTQRQIYMTTNRNGDRPTE